MDTLHVVHQVVMARESVISRRPLAMFVLAEVRPVTVTVETVRLALVTQ